MSRTYDQRGLQRRQVRSYKFTYVADRQTKAIRFITTYPNKVAWFFALVPHPERFIALPGRAAYRQWRYAARAGLADFTLPSGPRRASLTEPTDL